MLPVSENLITMGSKWAQWYIHKSMRPISNPNKIAPMMFNQPCECWDELEKQGKAASKRDQSQTGLDSAEREQANRREGGGKPKTKKSTNRKGK